MSNGTHALLSPSGAHRWMPCPGSVALERGMPDNGNDYSDEGSAAHMLAQIAWTEQRPASAYVGRRLDLGKRTWEVDESMADETQKYLNIVKALSVNGETFVEVVVPIGHITGEEGATGTADCVVIDVNNKELIVTDLKFGRGVRVFAKDNVQELLYALGVYDEYRLLYDFDRVRCIISQPRLDHVDEWTYSIAEMEEFRKRAETRAVVALGFRDATTDDACSLEPPDGGTGYAFLHPGDEQCQFCKAKAICPAAADRVKEAIGADFDIIVADIVGPNKIITESTYMPEAPADIGVKMDAIDFIEGWCKAIRARVETLLLQGVPVPSPSGGYKIVQGRQGNRAWTDEKEAEAALKGMRLKHDEMYTSKLISPTAAEKVVKEPKRWEKLLKFITRAEGGKSVAPMADKRDAISVAAVTADDFDDITTDGSDLI